PPTAPPASPAPSRSCARRSGRRWASAAAPGPPTSRPTWSSGSTEGVGDHLRYRRRGAACGKHRRKSVYRLPRRHPGTPGGGDAMAKQWTRRQLKPMLPTRTVSTTVTLHEQGREIQLHLLGRGHTDGDLYIYLPKEKVVATGDALIDWMPFFNDGYPEEWVQTLNALEKLDFTHIIPGHGEVLPKAHLTFFRGYL